LAGAGTDLPAYARRYGGLAISATIDRFAYAMVSDTSHPTVQIGSSDYGQLLDGDGSNRTDSFHRPAQAILKEFGIDRDVSVFITSELPPYTGVGAISGSAIALVWALARLQGRTMSPLEAASVASSAEVNRLALSYKGADAYGQALGGLTLTEVTEAGVCATPVPLSDDLRFALEVRLMLFFTGRVQRDLREIEEVGRAAERNRAGVIEALHEIKAAAIDLRNRLEQGEIDSVGDSLDRTWRATRRLGPAMTDPWVDQWYEMAVNAGASGGKVNGLGGPGFLLLYCQPDRQQRVTEALQSAGLRRVGVRFEPNGVALLLDESKTAATSTKPRSNVGNTRH
jgi:D-glycero-alpha-D-manno-heptose-7-phosphate kinase